MSVSMTWKPYQPAKGKSFAAGSNLHKYMECAFGSFPLILRDSDIPVLRGITCCGYDDLEEIIDAINEFGQIEIEDHW